MSTIALTLRDDAGVPRQFVLYGPAALGDVHLQEATVAGRAHGRLDSRALPRGVRFGDKAARSLAKRHRRGGEPWPCLVFDDLILWFHEALDDVTVQRLKDVLDLQEDDDGQ